MVVLHGRVDQQATPESWLIRQADGSRQCQVAAGAVSRNHHLAIVGGQRVEVIDDPPRRGHGVFMSRWEGIFGGQSIVDRHDRAVGVMSEPQAERVVGIQITDRPAATMEVDDEGAVARSVIHPRFKLLLG